MIGKAHATSLAAFMAFAVAAVGAFLHLRPAALGVSAFVAIAILGMWVAGRIFDGLASPEEKVADLEDRVRNSDI